MCRLRGWLLALAAGALISGSALAQQNWRWASPSPAAVAWRGVAYGNGTYVVVGDDATIATSPDGAVWTVRRMSTAGMILRAVAFGGGQFVAVGVGGPNLPRGGGALIMTSSDGVDWTINEAVMALGFDLLDVAYGGGVWVTVGSDLAGINDRRVFSSTDTRTWVSRTTLGPRDNIAAASGQLIAYGAGRFIMVGNNNVGCVSPDGLSWSVFNFSPPSGQRVESVAFGCGKFIAVGYDRNHNGAAFTSVDGSNWTSSTPLPIARELTAIAGSPTAAVTIQDYGLFEDPAAALAANALYRTTNGNGWTAQVTALPVNSNRGFVRLETATGLSYAGTQFFVLGAGGSITTSVDGVNWARHTTASRHSIGTVLHDGRRFVALGDGGVVLTSPEGSVWTRLVTDTNGSLSNTATDGTHFVAAGLSVVLHSTDLAHWSPVIVNTPQDWALGVVYGNGRFVLAPRSALSSTRTSSDGITWASHSPLAARNDNVTGLAFGGGVFVLSFGRFIYSSTDGAAWTDRTPAGQLAGGVLESMAYGGGRFVMFKEDGQLLTSIDGLHWTLSPQTSTLRLSGVAWVGGQFVARSGDFGYRYYSSLDGINWSALPNSTSNTDPPLGYAVAGDTVIAVGYSGSILRADRAATPALSTAGRLANLSIRTITGTGDNALQIGSALGGAGVSGGKSVLFRGVGPSLAPFGVVGALADPTMTIFRGSALLSQNDDWNSVFDFGAVGAFALAGSPPRDAGIYLSAALPNTYSIQIGGKANASGVVLAEIYDATPASAFTATTPRLVNISARAQVGTGDNVLIAGFVVGGGSDVRVLIRAVGPALTGFGVGGVLADPRLEVFRGSARIAENDNWDATAGGTFAGVGAFPLTAGSRDAALVARLAPGAYSVQVSGVADTTGVALVEIYELP